MRAVSACAAYKAWAQTSPTWLTRISAPDNWRCSGLSASSGSALAGREETDHLAWTERRLAELGGRTSLLNPLWYGAAFAVGLAAGRAGDRISLAFVVETERQVAAHLAGHLERLPASDAASRAVVAQMKDDEARHANEALQAGAAELPAPLKWLMRAAARVMTGTAHHI